MKRNGIELLKMIMSVILFAGAVLFIGFQVSQNRKIAEDARIKQGSRLDIAVVNEDQGGQLEGQPYDIGKSYIKHLEKDTSNNWTVVPRNLAEDGLDSGKYQLVVYIPSNFSKKVVDINSVTPEKATVTYKVNAKGNATVENMANQVGNRIVTDLDQQLVGVFMASILDNLYQAQQNVKTVVDTQGVNIGVYQDSILGVATNFRDSLPNLLDAARLSGGTNDQLISSLTSSTELFDNLETGEGEYSNSLQELMEKRAAGDISYGEFVENLVAMNNLIGQNQTLHDQIATNQAKLQASLATADDPVTVDKDETGGLKTSLTAQQKVIKERIQEATTNIRADLADYYSLPEADLDKITLAQFLDRNNGFFDTSALREQLANAQATLEKEEQGFTDTVNSFFEIDNSSGTFNNATITISSNRSNLTITGVHINGEEASSASLNKGINEVEFSYMISGQPQGRQGSSDIVVTISQKGSVAQSQAAVQQTKSGSSSHVIVRLNDDANPANPPQADQNQDQDQDQNNQPNPADPGANNQSPAQPDNGNGAVAVPTGQGLTFYLDADYSGYYSRQSYREALTRYNQLQGQVDYLNQPVGKYIEAQVTTALTSSMSGVGDSVDSSMGLLNNEITKIEQEAAAVTDNVATLLERYRILSGQVTTVQTAQDADRTSQSETTSALTALAPAFESLASASASARTASASNVTVAEGVRDNLANFEDTVARAESTTDELATDADSLSQSFSDELANNQDYVSSFVKVLNNAYNNGVPNEVLLDFLSNPVREEAQATKATANVFKPFTWVLLIAMASLFIAYVFSNSTVFQTTLDKFTKDENFLLFADSKTIIVSQMLTMLIGLVIGVVSLNQLNISAAYSVIWVFSVLLMTMFLAQWIYLGLKYWKSIGMGLALFVLVSYIYLTSAVGTTATLSGFPLVLRNINILSIFEGLLAGFFVKEPVALWQIFVLIVGLAIGITLGIFVKPKEVEEN